MIARRAMLLVLFALACGREPRTDVASVHSTPSSSPAKSSAPPPRPEPVPPQAKPVPVEVQIAPDEKLASMTRIPPDTEIELKRDSCFGTCPVYNLGVDARGNVLFTPIHHLAAKGTKTRKISQAAVLNLIHSFGRLGYMGIDEPKLRATCPRHMTDNPTVTTSLKIDGKKNTVQNYHGCPGGPLRDGLRKLEDEIDRVLAHPSWLLPGHERPMGGHL